ncbi:hypothetical protein PCLA_13f0021 [Pseudomonas citronellolis]|nr:hypothetical protein PCLA_13f0021 [Pseudomonas citronellolis]
MHPLLSSSELSSQPVINFLRMAQLSVALLIYAVELQLQLLALLRARSHLACYRLADLAPLGLVLQLQRRKIRSRGAAPPRPGQPEPAAEREQQGQYTTQQLSAAHAITPPAAR